MKRKLFRDALILLATFGLVWLVLTLVLPERDVEKGWLSEDQEEKLSEFIINIIEQQFKVIDSTEYDEGLDSIVAILHRQMESSKQKEYKVKVLGNSEINAFATLGGRIYFFKGMLEMAERPEEIAAVMAHEMGHIEHDHVIRRLISEFGITVLLGISTGDTLLIKEVIKMLSKSAFSRKQEREADDFALNLLHDSGISPRNLGTLFRKLQEAYDSNIPNVTIISSHPSVEERIKKSFEYDMEDFSEVNHFIPWPGVTYEQEDEESIEVEAIDSEL